LLQAIDTATNIILDTDAGNVQFKDGGTTYAELENSSGDVILYSATQDKDILFKGNDGGSAITALTLDMSEGGDASFAGDVGMVTGHSSGKFAVMSSSVHGSYDFYNNGTSYFNGDVTIDANLTQTTGTSATFSGSITLSDAQPIKWGTENILSHNGTQTYLGDATSASVLTLSGGAATFAGDVTLESSTSTKPFLTVKNTNADANAPQLRLIKDSASPADNDETGRIYMYGDNDAGQQIESVLIRGMMTDVSDGSEDSSLEFFTYAAGSQGSASLKLESHNATFAGNVELGDSTNISMSSGSAGQLQVQGSGYTGAIALNATAMYIYHNSSIRDLVLGTNETARLTIAGNSGNTSITGTFTAAGDVVAFSDERLKSNIETLDGSKVYDMRGVSFTKDNKDGSGVIAQELEKVAPELVNNDSEYKSVAYGNITGYLIEAIKDLKAEVEDLKKQLKNK